MVVVVGTSNARAFRPVSYSYLRMRSFVTPQVRLACKAFVAAVDRARVRFLARVDAQMDFHVGFAQKRFATDPAAELLVTLMDVLMALEVPFQ